MSDISLITHPMNKMIVRALPLNKLFIKNYELFDGLAPGITILVGCGPLRQTVARPCSKQFLLALIRSSTKDNRTNFFLSPFFPPMRKP